MTTLRHCARAWTRNAGPVVATMLVTVAAATVARADEPVASAAPLPAIDAAAVADWADSTFAAALARKEFSGLVVSVVRDGTIILARGYGRADHARPGPVDPSATLFRIGSITKTFTASLVARLLDEGRIESLDDPVNRYLRDYALPANDGVEITLHHLLTHTAGFEDRFFAIGADTPVPARLPAASFDALRPAYVRPAGARVVYSNFGVAVLGRMIEDVTGLPIDDAMQQMLFAPLGMASTRLLVEVEEPAALGKPATILPDGSFAPTPFTAINPAVAAAGSIVSTGQDMARYMIAQLGKSPVPGPDTQPVLSGAALAALHGRRAGNAPETTGVGMVFFTEEWGPFRTVAHGGNWAGFHSWMTLIPQLDAGVFISIMSEAPLPQAGDTLRRLLLPWSSPVPSPAMLSASGYTNQFLAHFLGERRPLPASSAPVDPSSIDGWYLADRRVFSTAESLADLLALGDTVLRARIGQDGGALTLGAAGPFRPAGNGIFVLDAPARPQLVIRNDPRVGAPVLIPDLGIYTLTRIAGYRHPRLHAYVLLAALVLAAGAWAVLARSARTAGRSAALVGTVTTGLAWLLPFLALASVFDGQTMMTALYTGHASPLAGFVAIANGLLFASLATAMLALRSPIAPRRIRVSLALIALAGLAICSVLAAYNAIGWKLPA